MTGSEAPLGFELRVAGRLGTLMSSALDVEGTRSVEVDTTLTLSCAEPVPLGVLVESLQGLGLDVILVREHRIAAGPLRR